MSSQLLYMLLEFTEIVVRNLMMDEDQHKKQFAPA